MRVIFAGTPDFAIPALEKLIESRHDVVAVMTQPDRPRGRGRKVSPSPVKEKALEHDIPVLQPEKLKKPPFADELEKYKPDVMVVAAYGKILPPEILELPKYGCINIHASLLPQYRGAAPVQHAIINCETRTGVTIMKMDETMDTGDILMYEVVPILEDDDALSVTNMLSVVGAELLLKALARIEETGEVRGETQDHEKATFAPRISREDCRLDWSRTFEQVLCKIRGLSPKPGAFSMLGKKPIKILKAEPFFATRKIHNLLLEKEEFSPGEIIKVVKGKGPLVRAGNGLIVLTKVKPAGKKAMSGMDAVNGNILNIGDKLK